MRECKCLRRIVQACCLGPNDYQHKGQHFQQLFQDFVNSFCEICDPIEFRVQSGLACCIQLKCFHVLFSFPSPLQGWLPSLWNFLHCEWNYQTFGVWASQSTMKFVWRTAPEHESSQYLPKYLHRWWRTWSFTEKPILPMMLDQWYTSLRNLLPLTSLGEYLFIRSSSQPFGGYFKPVTSKTCGLVSVGLCFRIYPGTLSTNPATNGNLFQHSFNLLSPTLQGRNCLWTAWACPGPASHL